MAIWRTVVGKMWLTIIALVAVVIIVIGLFLLNYIDLTFVDSSKVKHLFIYAGAVGFLLTTFFAFFLLKKITQPLREMKEAAVLIAQGDFTTRVAIRSSDEIGELANTFNSMSSEIDSLIHILQHERDHLSSVLRSMTDAVISFNAEGKVILTNPQGKNLLNDWITTDWSEEEAYGEGEVPVPIQETFHEVIRRGQDMTSRAYVKNEVFSVVMTPLVSTEGVRGAVAVFRNVTEEFKVEKLRTDFVANISHEIRTPLSMVQGYSEALLDEIATSPEERRELVQVIHDESLRMGRLVKDLLDLARMEAGHLELNAQVLDVQLLMNRVYRKFAVLTKEKGLNLIYEESKDKLILQEADGDRLEQVLTNLMDNAIRHTPPQASIRLNAELVRDKRGNEVRITVSDEGQGIPAEDLPYIFERFYKADKARKRDSNGGSGGTGLGLAIVRNIVEAHGGRIEAASEVGKGTTFTIHLPVHGKA
ncbi:HAMP domain-containing sensor histidine kinase [Cohnella thailandensis]|uniref:histidine kinase n=1 Tax=Cohnella thailandensis TaxID=557557 RepID=A0A841SZ51_9BACL|nr:ATP-binding protein [Cohnella thailandensis]MBB6635438.1 HAMP domain-containing protein [Cohnella thailandensis]MBP1974818.1 two-component system sensor histidine kinase ResE [Cohnella thailandensis]